MADKSNDDKSPKNPRPGMTQLGAKEDVPVTSPTLEDAEGKKKALKIFAGLNGEDDQLFARHVRHAKRATTRADIAGAALTEPQSMVGKIFKKPKPLSGVAAAHRLSNDDREASAKLSENLSRVSDALTAMQPISAAYLSYVGEAYRTPVTDPFSKTLRKVVDQLRGIKSDTNTIVAQRLEERYQPVSSLTYDGALYRALRESPRDEREVHEVFEEVYTQFNRLSNLRDALLVARKGEKTPENQETFIRDLSKDEPIVVDAINAMKKLAELTEDPPEALQNKGPLLKLLEHVKADAIKAHHALAAVSKPAIFHQESMEYLKPINHTVRRVLKNAGDLDTIQDKGR